MAISAKKPASKNGIQNAYFDWLCDLINANDPDHSFIFLCRHLHTLEFYWSVCNDDNRAGDGMALRGLFRLQSDLRIGDELDCDVCSVFEMLVALAICVEEIMDEIEPGDASFWFWMMLDNLGLSDYDDDHFYQRGSIKKIDKILDRFLDRTYQRSGKGGLFPLKKWREDQRTVEIWYQMQAYLQEKFVRFR